VRTAAEAWTFDRGLNSILRLIKKIQQEMQQMGEIVERFKQETEQQWS